ncbi:hypothetical protein DZF91_37710 [Actinomadura logoneensis]|uniref:Uncharacterized protein n=1 Tax=Actinomadura logoneensis TaxID=2293572 RepID=A0A372J940_9ACTN|nr:hypothetical protein [Actinomadura logoneensis]RFU36521.1 hypothetical protein DZF91_37710 [Actinomadura logoneensis]
MRFKGIHRRTSGGGARPGDARYSPSPPDPGRSRDSGAWQSPEPAQIRPRGAQPRDRFGRFRKGGRDDAYAARPETDAPGPDPAAAVGRHRMGAERPAKVYSWSDFELDDEPGPPRAAPRPPDSPAALDGLRHCGVLERVLHRQWDARQGPPSPEVVRAVESLAALPDALKRRLADGLSGIYVGPGGVPHLDDMGHLRGRPLPSGRATWDICAGAYGDRKIVVGDRPSPTPDVMMHEVGHALDDLDGGDGGWQSDMPAFQQLYEMCRPYLMSDFHQQPDALGRREFFADAFAAISARQRPALVDMLSGNIRAALEVMLFFNRRYGI